jgi:trehalose/maltose hydrolase-like predicted phosphorylase
VLMLFYLLSAEELLGLLNGLGYRADPTVIPKAIEYYMPRTSHGSTLSAVVHAWVLARSDRHGAVEFFSAAMKSDLTDVQGGTTAEGIHLAAMTGSVDLLQRCFAGVETRQDTLWLNPLWPPHLGVLEFSIRYRGQPVTLQVSGRTVAVTTGTDIAAPIRLGYGGHTQELGPGQTVEFTINSST